MERRPFGPVPREVAMIGQGTWYIDDAHRPTAVAAGGERIIGGMSSEQRDRYAVLMRSIISQAQAAIARGVSAEEAGRVIADAITSKRPRTRYTIGRDAAIIVRLVRLLSDRALDSLLARGLKPDQPKAPPAA